MSVSIPQLSEAAMTAAGLPPAGEVYEFLNTDKNNALYFMDSSGNFIAAGMDEDCCACRITEKWMCGLNEAMLSGLMTPAQYQAAIDAGFTVNVSNDGAGNCDVQVGLVVSVSLDKHTLNLLLLSPPNTITATVNPSYINQAVTWTSDNVAVATVSASGVVTVVGAGTCHIRAYSVYNPSKYDTCVVTIA